MTRVCVTIRIADAHPGPTLEVLLADLFSKVHADAAAMYGHDPNANDWHARGFAGEGHEHAGRAAFIHCLTGMGAADKLDEFLAEWDKSGRPVAIVHWYEGPALN